MKQAMRLALVSLLAMSRATAVEPVAGVLKLVGHMQPASPSQVVTSLVVNYALSDGELGAISTPAAGDLVVILAASTSNSAYRAIGITGFTSIDVRGVTDGTNPFLSVGVFKKTMGGTPDTSFTITHPTGGTSGGCTYQVFVFRAHNDVEDFAVTATNDVNDITPPARTIAGADRISLALCAIGSVNLTANPTIAQSPATMERFGFVWVSAGIQSDHGTASGMNHVDAGAHTPPQFVTSSVVADTSFVAYAIHIVIAPAP